MKSSAIPILRVALAAVFFGLNAPLAKLLLNQFEPIALAAWLYLGCGLGLLAWQSILQLQRKAAAREPELTSRDLPWLAGAIISGGVLGPILLFVSLARTPASTAALLLNFEAVATTIIATLFFKEAVGRQAWAAIALVTTAGVLLTANSARTWGISLGSLGVVGACFLWGLDNNFTRNISARNPLTIVIYKGLGAGLTSLLLAYLLNHSVASSWQVVPVAMLVGFVSYGLSLLLFILAMRDLGAARTSGVFGIAPFIGALLSLVIFRESPSPLFIVSLPVMLGGALLLISENHAHRHLHTVLVHEHRHEHIETHHQHEQAPTDKDEAHTHLHEHDSEEHVHPHTPDIHHRHDHHEE